MTLALKMPLPQQRSAALTAGLSIITMAILAIFSIGYAFGQLIILEDAIMTMNNIQQDISLFVLGIIGLILIFICDLLASWGLWGYFKRFDETSSKWMAGFRLVYTIILGIAIATLVLILPHLPNSTLSASEVLDQIQNFYTIWSFGLIIFGLHLLFLGFIALRETPVPKTISWLLLIAAVGYLFNNIASLSSDHYLHYKPIVEMIFSLPMIFGELGLGIWLIVQNNKKS